jgi:hypothetical protein
MASPEIHWVTGRSLWQVCPPALTEPSLQFRGASAADTCAALVKGSPLVCPRSLP